jgi:hypothetical protein
MSVDPKDPKAQVAFSLKTRKAVTASNDDDAKKKQEQSQDAASGKQGNDGVVGEDELLSADDRKAKTAMKLDCASRRRACKNCVCGRAEVEAKLIAEGKMTADGDATWQPPAGGCGNCSKGDAFRCATCPFRSLPAWTTTTAQNGAVQLNVADDLDG